MKIREVEIQTGITKQNIRFYEKKGLISPARCDNSYREYEPEDVERLEKIKILRALGLAIPQILEVMNGRLSLEQALTKRLAEAQHERETLDDVERICHILVEQKISFDNLNTEVISESSTDFKARVQEIILTDVDQVKLTPQHFLNTVTILLLLGNGLALLVCCLLVYFNVELTETGDANNIYGGWLFGTLAVVLAISVVAYLAVYLIQKPWVNALSLIVVSLMITPTMVCLLDLAYRIFGYGARGIQVIEVLPVLGAVILFIMINHLFLMRRGHGNLSLVSYGFFVLLYGMTAGFAVGQINGKFWFYLIVSCIIVGYVALSTMQTVCHTREYSLYSAVETATKVMGALIFFISLYGYYGYGNWRRDGREFK